MQLATQNFSRSHSEFSISVGKYVGTYVGLDQCRPRESTCPAALACFEALVIFGVGWDVGWDVAALADLADLADLEPTVWAVV